MVDGHDDVLDKLRSRVDKDTLDKWKAQTRDAEGKKVEEKVEAVTITPEKSDNAVTMSINELGGQGLPRCQRASRCGEETPGHRQEAHDQLTGC